MIAHLRPHCSPLQTAAAAAPAALLPPPPLFPAVSQASLGSSDREKSASGLVQVSQIPAVISSLLLPSPWHLQLVEAAGVPPTGGVLSLTVLDVSTLPSLFVRCSETLRFAKSRRSIFFFSSLLPPKAPTLNVLSALIIPPSGFNFMHNEMRVFRTILNFLKAYQLWR